MPPVRWETLTVNGQAMRVYLGVPEGAPRRAGILVAQHGPGVDGFIQDVVNRLFRQGYVAAAPELFHRYNGAAHAFQNFLDAARYRERPASGTWSEMLAFFSQHLKP